MGPSEMITDRFISLTLDDQMISFAASLENVMWLVYFPHQ